MKSFDSWILNFHNNSARHQQQEALIDWRAPLTISARERHAFVHSFQRFELGEGGEGVRLLALAADAGDPTYTRALELLVQEEQKHSALFGRGLRHLGAPTLTSHWTDAAFTRLRHLLGLRTEIGLFLVAESIAMGYFVALAENAPDPVLRGIGQRIMDDERDHIRFQIDRLRVGFQHTPAPVRLLVGVGLGVIAAGAAAVLVVDHRGALRACGLEPLEYWGRAMRSFRVAAQLALANPDAALLGPLAQTDHEEAARIPL
jgi:hypothetical protein